MKNNQQPIPFSDMEDSESQDQLSQRDIHSSGLSENNDPVPLPKDNTLAFLDASRAAESSYTLNFEDGIAPKEQDKGKS